MYDEDEYYDDCCDELDSEDWEADTWDAMTDGQYGDYPGGCIDYDALGFGGKRCHKKEK